MATNPLQNDEENSIVVHTEKLMVPTVGDDGNPTLRKSHFLKPLLNPKNQPLTKNPSFSLSKKPNIKDLTKRVRFRGRIRTQNDWKSWVDDLVQTHEAIWKKVGILDAIRASTYQIKRDNELIVGLAEKWCPETNTFVFPWGEATVSLEDVLVLGGFSVLGVSVLSEMDDFGDIENHLANACCLVRRKSGNLLTHYGWMNHFKGMGGELEHVGMLALWLSRYVFPLYNYSVIAPNVFRVAMSLVRGTRVAFAPAVLASVYRDLTMLKQKIVASISEGRKDRSELVLLAPFNLVQLWVWERFPTLSPIPASLDRGEPRLARWHGRNRLNVRSLRLEIESARDNFVWRPYTLCLENWEFPKFYCDDGKWVLINSEVHEDILSFARCLRACELVGMNCVENYLPHRIGMQFGFDQDIPNSVPRSDNDSKLAWSSYDKPLDGLKLYFPPRLFEADVTLEYSRWWIGASTAHEESLMDMVVNERQSKIQNKVKKLSVILHENGGASSEKAQTSAGPTCNEAIVASSKGMVMEKSPTSELLPSQSPEARVNEIVENTEKSDYLASNSKDDKKEEVNGSPSQNRSSRAVNEPLSTDEHSKEPEMKTPCSMPMEDKQGEEVEMKQVSHSTNDVVVIDDAEGDDGHTNPFERQCSDFEARMSRVERVVSMLQDAKFGSKSR